MNVIKLILFVLGAASLFSGFIHRALFQFGIIHKSRTSVQKDKYLLLDLAFIGVGVVCLITLNNMD